MTEDGLVDALQTLEEAMRRDMGAGYAGVALVQAILQSARLSDPRDAIIEELRARLEIAISILNKNNIIWLGEEKASAVIAKARALTGGK